MKFKLVPEPPASLDVVTDAQRAVPLVPDTEDDCCARLMRRLDFPSRDVARTWLTFLRALRLAEETPSGFKRTDVDPTRETLREAFVDRVFGASEVVDALEATEALTADEAFERLRDRVPTWEHHKNPTEWEAVWRERVERVLDWLTLLGAAERTADGRYRRA
ncbi:MAG: hypothetical protein ABEJ78_02795 [Haloferacaceae archaeon]